MKDTVTNFVTAHVSENLVGDDRTRFLRLLKDDGPELYECVEGNLLEWMTVAAFKLREPIVCNGLARAAQEIVQHWKQFFAAELAAIR
ncbi:MAG TPA: hypothetical protein DEF00_03675 [Candidatus Taylorbacteria bacterium]|nr:MAG: hypothetical protein UY03_C0001G0029 [Parcubacteria group bacterium GW2011_GWA2_47_64]KKU96175.1 MAG: hypothetical protein UY29_C0015G0015 [Parcubacteria group bacterium GW2011_GWC2_48_17]HBV01463.1 hypothetical protein [Candidatus Taylorbacteria bacterium]